MVNKLNALRFVGSQPKLGLLKQLRKQVHFNEIMTGSYIFDEKKSQFYMMLKAVVDKQS